MGVACTVPLLHLFVIFHPQGYQPYRAVLEEDGKKNLVLENEAAQSFLTAGLMCLSIDI